MTETTSRGGFYRLAQVIEPGRVPVCKATLWRWVQQGKFPAPIKLSVTRTGRGGVTAWRASDVEAWLKDHADGLAAKKGGVQ